MYWKTLQRIPAVQILSHRILWSFLFLIVLIGATRRWSAFRNVFRSKKQRRLCFLTAGIIAGNWLTYIWGVNTGHIVETSLGYFINPLISVLLGIVFLKEKWGFWPRIAFGMALAGVVYQTAAYGRFPWIAMTLALTFGFYGLLRKVSGIGALTGLTAEVAILSPLALVFLLVATVTGEGLNPIGRSLEPMLLFGSGIVTAGPMLLFVMGVRRVPLTTVGFLQYLAPTMQLLIGVLIYGEPFGRGQLISFGFIWSGLIIFSLSRLFDARTGRTNL